MVNGRRRWTTVGLVVADDEVLSNGRNDFGKPDLGSGNSLEIFRSSRWIALFWLLWVFSHHACCPGKLWRKRPRLNVATI